MLPFMKPKRAASTIIMHRRSSGEKTSEQNEQEVNPELHDVASSLISAIHGKDVEAVAAALKSLLDNPGATSKDPVASVKKDTVEGT